MKNIFPLFILSLYCCSPTKNKENSNNQIDKTFTIEYSKQDQNELKVIELFTSESCSDCPAGEHAMFVLDSAREDVICIAEHVDYWNGLVWGDGECNGNWIDKYSTGDNTVRHANYARQLNQIQATPQVVINGRLMLPDSKYDSLDYLLDNMKIKPAFSVKLDAPNGIDNNRKVDVNFECFPIESVLKEYYDSIPVRAMLYIYVLESGMISKPNKGENCGKTLPGHNIVRAQKITSLRNLKKGVTSIQIPDDAIIENCKVVALVQNLKTYEILGSSYGFSFYKN